MGTPAGHPAPPEARELTPQEQEAEARLCYGIHNNVVAALREGRASLWKLAEHLADFDEHAGWSRLGYDTKTAWLADPDVGLTQRTYRRLIRAWRVLHGRFGLDRPTLASLELSKVDIVLPAIEKGSRSLQDAIDDVQTLGARDLRETYWGTEETPATSTGDTTNQGGTEPAPDPPDGSGPVRASDGAPVDVVFEKEGDTGEGGVEVIDADAEDITHELAAENGVVPDLDKKHFVRCEHCGGIVSVDDAEKAAPPPTI